MPQRDPGVYLEDIEYYADAAVRFIGRYTLEQYLADEKTRAAVERKPIYLGDISWLRRGRVFERILGAVPQHYLAATRSLRDPPKRSDVWLNTGGCSDVPNS